MSSKSPGWFERLKIKWGVNGKTLLIILLVFACTGFTVAFLKTPVVNFFTGEEQSWVFTALYYILILPIYNVILLVYGFVFGQFNFFWNYEKRMFQKLFGKK